MRWFWGSILILIGLIYLALNINIINNEQLGQLWRFWPLLLIIYGIALLFNHIKFGWIAILLALIFSVAFVYYSLSSNLVSPESIKSTSSKFSSNIPQTSNNLKVTVNTGAVNLIIKSTSKREVTGNLDSNFLKPSLNTKSNDNQTAVEINTNRMGGTWPGGKNRLEINITDNIPVELIINSGASQSDINLENIVLSSLKINTGASSTKLKLGEKTQNNSKINISSGASKLSIEINNSLGTKIINDSPVSKVETNGFTKDSNIYTSKNYDDKKKKIEIKLSVAASEINIKTK